MMCSILSPSWWPSADLPPAYFDLSCTGEPKAGWVSEAKRKSRRSQSRRTFKELSTLLTEHFTRLLCRSLYEISECTYCPFLDIRETNGMYTPNNSQMLFKGSQLEKHRKLFILITSKLLCFVSLINEYESTLILSPCLLLSFSALSFSLTPSTWLLSLLFSVCQWRIYFQLALQDSLRTKKYYNLHCRI